MTRTLVGVFGDWLIYDVSSMSTPGAMNVTFINRKARLYTCTCPGFVQHRHCSHGGDYEPIGFRPYSDPEDVQREIERIAADPHLFDDLFADKGVPL